MTDRIVLAVLLGGLLPAMPVEAAEESTAERPNIVFFLVDDLGWADLGCYGSAYHRTPQIDALAADGVRFTQAYAACPVCSPTRASILTGRHPVRVDITDWIPGLATSKRADAKFEHIDDRDNLALEEVTLAETLAEAGYRRWFLGKWHLGDAGHYPTDQGFEVNIGGNHRGSPPGGYYAPWRNPTLQANDDGEYLTERLTDEAVGLIDRHVAAKSGEPFLLFLSYYNVHTPITAYEKRVGEFDAPDDATPTRDEHDGQTRLRQDNPAYASMIAAVDDSVGRVLSSLAANSLDNTYVVFFSDNGGLSTAKRMGPTSNLPLRAGKGWLYEGGIREPLLIAGPGIAPGTSEQVVMSTDLAPTLIELAGLPPRLDLHADGQSIADHLLTDPSERTTQPRTLYWHYPHYHGSTWAPGAAIRDGDWKLIEQYHYGTTELYDLAADVGERNDLSANNPEKRDELRRKLAEWQAAMGAKMPQPIAGSR